MNKHHFPDNEGSRASAPAGPSNNPAAPGVSIESRPDRSAPGRAPPLPETGSDTEHTGTWGTRWGTQRDPWKGGTRGDPNGPGRAEPTRYRGNRARRRHCACATARWLPEVRHRPPRAGSAVRVSPARPERSGPVPPPAPPLSPEPAPEPEPPLSPLPAPEPAPPPW